MSKKIQLTVDGRPVEADEGAMLLEVLREMGIHVPTLCHHPSLEPSGACRLCVVEITHPDWRGWSGLVTSCLYPVEPGLQVSTLSERVRSTRRTLLELYLARCPDAEEVKALARNEGVDFTPYPVEEDADKCVLCGLCTRVCVDLGPGAIAPLGRGADKLVGPRPDRFGEDCTGCLACAKVCPTGEIRMEQGKGIARIWNREFKLPLCKVTPDHCRACGVCEEVCPLAIPRVTAFKTGNMVANISPDVCTGCGICAGACPAGAITQEGVSAEDLAGSGSRVPEGGLRDRTVVFACSRSPLPEGIDGAVLVPCVGRVPVESMLECLARGAKGVLMLCRDQATCPSGPGGALGEERAIVADALAASAGLGRGRIQCVKPRIGPGGPEGSLEAFERSLDPSPLEALYDINGKETEACGMDRALRIMAWLKTRPELEPCLPLDLEGALDPSASDGDTLLYLGDLPDLDLLLSLVIREWRLKSLIEDGLELLRRKGINALPVMTARAVEESTASRVVVFSRSDIPDFGPSKKIITLKVDEKTRTHASSPLGKLPSQIGVVTLKVHDSGAAHHSGSLADRLVAGP